MADDLERVHRGRVPLPEVSGLSSTYDGTSARLVAVGDDRVSLAVCAVADDGSLGEWTVVTTHEVVLTPLRESVSQALGVASAPARVVVVDNIPMLSTGKPDRLSLAALVRD